MLKKFPYEIRFWKKRVLTARYFNKTECHSHAAVWAGLLRAGDSTETD